MDPRNGEFALVKANVQVPSVTREYGVNSSNFRHWDNSIKAYVLDCTLGKDGPRQEDFNTRWTGSLVADSSASSRAAASTFTRPTDAKASRAAASPSI